MLFLIQKEFKQFFRNKFLPKLMFAFPIVAILVMPWVANMEIKNVNLSVIDFDNSQISRELIDKISHSSFFNITHFSKNKADSMNCIYENLCDIILEIPSDFSQNLRRENTANIGIMANSINSSKGVLGSGYLANIVNDFSPKITLLNQNKSEIITSQFLFNPALDYKIYMIPALSVMILTMICGFLPAFNIIGEKQKGNLEQLNVTPISKAKVILSKIIPFWILGLVVLSLCFLLAWAVYGLTPKGGFALAYAFAVMYILVVTGMGLVISNYSNTMQQAMFVAYFFILILILLSGLFTSVKSMPFWAQILTYFNPLRYFIESLRYIFLKGGSLSDLFSLNSDSFSIESITDSMLLINFAALLLFALFFNLWAILSYKKQS